MAEQVFDQLTKILDDNPGMGFTDAMGILNEGKPMTIEEKTRYLAESIGWKHGYMSCPVPGKPVEFVEDSELGGWWADVSATHGRPMIFSPSTKLDDLRLVWAEMSEVALQRLDELIDIRWGMDPSDLGCMTYALTLPRLTLFELTYEALKGAEG